MKKVNIGVAGLGFGKEFAAIYCDHPLVDKVAICTRNPETLNKVGEELGIPEELRFTNYDDMISHEELDAIHIVTPIKEHYPQSIKALRAGKHTACTVPMATSLDEFLNWKSIMGGRSGKRSRGKSIWLWKMRLMILLKVPKG